MNKTYDPANAKSLPASHNGKAFNRKSLAQAFAAQSAPAGRASSLYFVGRVAYSYGTHFPLAVILQGEPRRALVNGDKYSPTTSRHQSEIRYALARAGIEYVERDTDTMRELARQVRGYRSGK